MKKQKEHIGHKIKRIRSVKGMKQEDLANAIGKTRSLISHFERTGIINKYTLQEISSVLGFDVDAIEASEFEANHLLEDPEKMLYNKDRYKETIEKQREEIVFLKDTIHHQWQLLHELAKRK